MIVNRHTQPLVFGSDLVIGAVPGGVNWWLSGGILPANCAAAYQAKGAASYAASKVNLNAPGTNNAIDGVAFPTWDAVNGWAFNAAASQYLLAGALLPANDQSWSAIVRFSGVTNSGYLCGKNQGANRIFGLQPNVAGTVLYGNGTAVSVAPVLLAGNLCIGGAQGYRNGLAEGAACGAWGAVASGWAIGIGCQTSAGAIGNPVTGNIQAIAFYKTAALMAAQVLAVATAMAAL